MLLRRFSVTGYKNLRQSIVLDDLGPINLIHGPNNVGKSNLLQAMALFFRCLGGEGELPISAPRKLLASEEVQDLVTHPRDMFDLEKPFPIKLHGEIHVSKDELDAAGIVPLYPTDNVTIEILLEWIGDAATVQITRFEFGTGPDAVQKQSSAEEKTRILRFSRFLAQNMLVREGFHQRFSIINVDRDLEEDFIWREKDKIPLALEMYDCRESTDTIRRNRWRGFVRAMQSFQDTTGEGEFEVTYQRSESRARLMFDTENARIPFRLLGTGVQQLAALFGHLFVRNASIVAIEEPELNLRWDLQNKLREALKDLVLKSQRVGGVNQIFITSHSPAFETNDSFFLMERTPDGPRLTRRSTSMLSSVLHATPSHLGLPENAPQAYVTGQGVIQFPDDVVDRLGVRGGGGVVILDAAPNGVRILSDDQYLDELGLIDEAKDAS